jgi:hypothetical protein
VLAQRLWSRRDGSAASPSSTYDVVGVLTELAPDVAVLQESWSPDGATPAVHELAAGWNAIVHEAVFGRGRVEPFPHMSYRPERATSPPRSSPMSSPTTAPSASPSAPHDTQRIVSNVSGAPSTFRASAP